jgi:hypothetical protein
MNTQTRYNFQTGQFEPVQKLIGIHDDFDDYLTADDYDQRRAERDGWTSQAWDGR